MLKKPSHAFECAFIRHRGGVRTMKNGANAAQCHPHTRPRSFGNISAQSNKQFLDIPSRHVSAHRDVKNLPQRLAMLVVHSIVILQTDIIQSTAFQIQGIGQSSK